MAAAPLTVVLRFDAPATVVPPSTDELDTSHIGSARTRAGDRLHRRACRIGIAVVILVAAHARDCQPADHDRPEQSTPILPRRSETGWSHGEPPVPRLKPSRRAVLEAAGPSRAPRHPRDQDGTANEIAANQRLRGTEPKCKRWKSRERQTVSTFGSRDFNQNRSTGQPQIPKKSRRKNPPRPKRPLALKKGGRSLSQSKRVSWPVVGSGPAEGGGGDGPGAPVQAGFAARSVEELRDDLGGAAFAAHPDAEPRIVEPAAVQGADAIQDLVFAVGVMLREPVLEQAPRRPGVAG